MTTGTVHGFTPMGSELLVVCADAASESLVPTIAATLGAYPAELDLGGTTRLELRVHDDRDDADPGWPDVRATSEAEGISVTCGSSRLDVHHPTASAVLGVSRSLAAIPDAVRLLAEAAFTSIHVAGGRLHAVHAALVVRDEVGLMLRGASGAGKSTLTYACLRRGMAMASDDWLYAPAGRPVDAVAGYPWRMMLTEEAATRFPELAGVGLVPHTSAEGWKLPVRPPATQQRVTHRIDAVVLLDPSTDLGVHAVDADEARRRFWHAALDDERLRLDTAWVDDLLSRPTFVLRRGTSPDDAAQLLDDLARSLASERPRGTGDRRTDR